MGAIGKLAGLAVRLALMLVVQILIAVLPLLIRLLGWSVFAAGTATTATILGVRTSVETIQNRWKNVLHQIIPFEYESFVDTATSIGAWALIIIGWLVIALFFTLAFRVAFGYFT